VTHFYCLLGGELHIISKAADGAEQLDYIIQAGEYFGESSLLEGKATRSRTVRCSAAMMHCIRVARANPTP
jgi:CRP-like cAMP-binding protein